jgi:hypothetical protein
MELRVQLARLDCSLTQESQRISAEWIDFSDSIRHGRHGEA